MMILEANLFVYSLSVTKKKRCHGVTNVVLNSSKRTLKTKNMHRFSKGRMYTEVSLKTRKKLAQSSAKALSIYISSIQ